MGARQSKRSVDISAGATKAEKGPAGEPLENGTITASADDKQVVEANGGVEETPKQNGSTPHADDKETTETVPSSEEVKEPVKTAEEKDETVAPVVSEANGDLDTTVDESVKSPTDDTAEVASAEKKRKKKKSWSFRSISFSKKDKSKPTIKEQNAADVKTETVPEVVEEEIVKEEAKPAKSEPTDDDVPKAVEESPAAVEEKEPASETTNVAEIPPPLPSSPPPVETPVVAPTPTIVETPAPVQPTEPEIPQAEPEDDTVGGGEGLAEPPEGLNTSDIEKEVAEVPMVNGNHVEEVKSEPSSPEVNCLSEKIEAIKLSNVGDISGVNNENDVHETNGVSDAVAVTNGNGGIDGDD